MATRVYTGSVYWMDNGYKSIHGKCVLERQRIQKSIYKKRVMDGQCLQVHTREVCDEKTMDTIVYTRSVCWLDNGYMSIHGKSVLDGHFLQVYKWESCARWKMATSLYTGSVC
ncbi:hypothetical protein ACJMK2_038154 [Sinanodonta woodiana]|uniref:Uncharacterized protein n=1 Tax=Sinanodonta woodiana TaxID=1069815 RepID=A0ABD3WRT5_SINWO